MVPSSVITRQPPRVTEFPVVQGTIRSAKGHLGAFELVVDDYAAPAPSSRSVLTFGVPRDGAVSRCDLIVDLSGGENALWGGIAEEREPGLDALSRIRADAFPGSVRAAPEQAVLRASEDFYRDDVLDRPTRKHAGGPEPVKAGLRPLAGEG